MAEGANIAAAQRAVAMRVPRAVAWHWPALLGLIVPAVPTIVSLGNQTWATEGGAHGPIVLATGLWLLHYNRLTIATPSSQPGWSIVPLLVSGLVAYVFGRAFDFISVEAGGLYLTGLATVAALAGWREFRRNLFPLFYLGFIVPPPGWLMDSLTLPLRTFVSYASVGVLQLFGYPVAREGVALTIAQYQLLVEDACSGMNSLTGLTAVSLFYIFLMHRASWRYAALLIALILPIAIMVNILRVIGLILLTYYFGDAVGQSFLHETLGIALFITALLVIYFVDHALQGAARLYRGRAR